MILGFVVAATSFVNGLWFDGRGFQPRTVYVVDARLTFKEPAKVDRTVDLKGWYVVPPYGEAHNHNLTSEHQLDEMASRYLSEGVFYAKMQSSLPRLADPVRPRLNRPDSVDVVFANGPLTASGGHPVALRERLLDQGVYPGFTRDTLNNQGYVLIDSPADLEQKWPMILGFRPDFIKAMLVSSEEFERRRDDPAYVGRKGLDPKILPAVVARAHAAGLRVSVHVNTAADFHNAVVAGADEIAHLPGYSDPAQIAPEDARLAATRGVVVVTTASLALRRRDPPERYEKIRAAEIENLRLLHQSGVAVAIGSDDVAQTSLGELRYLKELGVFDNRQLLKMWSEITPRTIFPERKIGALQEGYEASFLALEGNPIEDFEALARIRYRVKQGLPLTTP